MKTQHIPVLLDEVIAGLQVSIGNWYIDATVGGGGHTQAILNKGGRVIAFDQDPHALALVESRFSSRLGKELFLIQANFSQLKSKLDEFRAERQFNLSGILFDLGTSSFQLDDWGVGFSFQRDEALDMRMSPDLQVTAADLLGALGKKELTGLFKRYGGEEQASKLADAIIQARSHKPIKSTQDLVDIIMKHKPKTSHLHPATKVFQALRIAVNDELNSLETSLPQAVSLLDSQGRLAVISFHEGEDRIVKNFINDNSDLKIINSKPITPSAQELAANPRARSAKLRLAEKC